MNPIRTVASVSALVLCVMVPGAAWAADEFGQMSQQSATPPKAKAAVPAPKAEPPPSKPAKASGPSMSVTGEIVLRQVDAKDPKLVYLRIKDGEGRVWLVSVGSASQVTLNGAGASSKELIEGAQVSASFARGGDSVPVADAVNLVK